MPDEKHFKELSEEIIGEMNAWNASHPKATFLQIEEKARELVSQAVQTARGPCSREASESGIYKPPPAETFNWKEPTEPVPLVEPGFSPLDEQLGLQPGSLTPLQLQHLVHFASLHSFGQAAKLLAVRILDFYHAAEYVSEIATLLSNAGTPLKENWVHEQLHELKQHGPAKVLEEVGRLLKDHPDLEDLETKGHYLQKREPLMHYPLFQQQGWPIGSGSAESANTGVVQDRLKGPGMHWDGRNVNPLLALRIAVCNDCWEGTMQQASRQRLLTRRARRFARQKNKYDELTHEVKRLVLRLFLLLPPPQLKPAHLAVSAPPRDLLAASSGATDSRQTRRPAPSHPWRRYPHAKK